MGNKNDFFISLNRLSSAARDAFKDIPEGMSERERKIVTAFLTRIPDQIEDIQSFIDDPHKVTHVSDRRIIDPF
jgi:hypothetical protein